jgi:hypothetical protein
VPYVIGTKASTSIPALEECHKTLLSRGTTQAAPLMVEVALFEV